MTKPEDKTWDGYMFADGGKEADEYGVVGEMRDERVEFAEAMEEQARAALKESGLDETRYVIGDGDGRPEITSNDGWELTEKEDALELRDVLHEAGIGDESVGVYVSPRDSQGEVAELPPDHVSVDVEYEVQIRISRIMHASDAGLANAESKTG